jgi:hypothetical protein
MESKLNNMNNNKLIAEFMGMEDHQEMGEYVTPNYNTSWDWLMRVVEKIESLGYEFTIVESRCKVSNNTDHSVEELFHIETIGSKFKTTYDAVVQFIKVNKIEVLISKLKSADLDGETTQYILEQIGMDYQMYKQLNVKYENNYN